MLRQSDLMHRLAKTEAAMLAKTEAVMLDKGYDGIQTHDPKEPDKKGAGQEWS